MEMEMDVIIVGIVFEQIICQFRGSLFERKRHYCHKFSVIIRQKSAKKYRVKQTHYRQQHFAN